MYLERRLNRGIILILLIILFYISLITFRPSINYLSQVHLDYEGIFPRPELVSQEIQSSSLIQQQQIISYLENTWNLSELTENDLFQAIEIICKAVIACSSVSYHSTFEEQVYEAFDLIMSSLLSNSKITLNFSSTGLFYIWDGVSKNVSTSLNLWIAKALLKADKTYFPTSTDIIDSIIRAVNQSCRGNSFLRESILLDSEDNPILPSLSSIAKLNDQLLMMTLLKQFLPEVSNESRILELQDLTSLLESSVFDPFTGFIEEIILNEADFSMAFFHSIKDQDQGGSYYYENKSTYSFHNSLLLLEFIFQQLQDYSILDPSSNLDLFDLNLANLYMEYLIHLLSEIQLLFQHETSLYHENIIINNNTNLIASSTKLYMNDQFHFIHLLSQITEWFSFKSPIDVKIYSDQFQEINFPLWNYLSEKAFVKYSEPTTGVGSTNSNGSTISGYFFAYFSTSLGLFLFDNTIQGSLLLANILALNSIGSIFPFKLNIDYYSPLNLGEIQNLFIKISPIQSYKVNLSSGFYSDVQFFLSVPIERINGIIISSSTISILANTSLNYNYTVSEEGTTKFSFKLIHKQAIFFSIDAEYLVLKTMSLNFQIIPVVPKQGDQITISLEVRDNKGIMRKGIYFSAKIQSNTWNQPLIITNQTLYYQNGTQNVITLNSDKTQSDLMCYFIVEKDGYYPSELNKSIHLQTSLNFLFNWLIWFIFESEIGGYIGTLSALFAIMYGFYSKFLSRIVGRTKTCHYCGESWKTKYPVCSHCGRILKPSKLTKSSFSHDSLDQDEFQSVEP